MPKTKKKGRWQDKLTKAERSHFYYATHGANTIEAFKAVREKQLKIDPKYGMCFDCVSIARKIGLPQEFIYSAETLAARESNQGNKQEGGN